MKGFNKKGVTEVKSFIREHPIISYWALTETVRAVCKTLCIVTGHGDDWRKCSVQRTVTYHAPEKVEIGGTKETKTEE